MSGERAVQNESRDNNINNIRTFVFDSDSCHGYASVVSSSNEYWMLMICNIYAENHAYDILQ
jgi:hypothetical protein